MPETASLVLLKADKGLKELASSRPTLDIKSRQVLILADGERSLGEIQVLRPSLDVRELAGALVADGFLQDPTGLLPTARIAPVPDHVTPDAPPAIESDRLTQIKALMIDSARQHLGLLGGEIIAEIAQSRTLPQIRNCVAQWHMALRQSRHGKKNTQQLLDSVQQLLKEHA